MRETTKRCDVLQAGFLWLRIGVPTIKKRVTQNKNDTRKGVKRALRSLPQTIPLYITKAVLDSTSTSLA